MATPNVILASRSPEQDPAEKSSGRRHSVVDSEVAPGGLNNGSPLSPLQPVGRFYEEWSLSSRGSSIIDDSNEKSASKVPQEATLVSQGGGTLKKASVRRADSMKQNASRRSTTAGSVPSLVYQPKEDIDEKNSAFFSPVPTIGSPTDLLADRFQAWRKVLKHIITYFREIQASYDNRAKCLLKVSNVLDSSAGSLVLKPGGIVDATRILREYHQTLINEAIRSRDIENDVIQALGGLRSDLGYKIKEIKGLSGDFKNSVDKEMEATRKAVNELQEGLGLVEIDPGQVIGKRDPYLLKLAVDQQIEKQIAEENYLHLAYLNLEASGRELEAVIVDGIQNLYNAYAGILKREADIVNSAADQLLGGPIAVPKDYDWNQFILNNKNFVDPQFPVRKLEHIQYPGKDNELAQEIKAGWMERKSKYLKSYTTGWYVLSPTHLHEFKSADKTQPPVMSLYLPEQRLGSHSNVDSTSGIFVLKGRQTGTMHRGHSWVFRCESHEVTVSWYEALRALVEKTPNERDEFVKRYAQDSTGALQRVSSIGSSDDINEDDYAEPFQAAKPVFEVQSPNQDVLQTLPRPGGPFPSSGLVLDAERHGDVQDALAELGGNLEAAGITNLGKISGTNTDGSIPTATKRIIIIQRPEEDLKKPSVQVATAESQNRHGKDASRIPHTDEQNGESEATTPKDELRSITVTEIAFQPSKSVESSSVEGKASEVEKVTPPTRLHVPGAWSKANSVMEKGAEN